MNKFDIKELVNKKDPLILDIGCYNGKDSKGMSDILNCDVHCFECDPLTLHLFKNIHSDNPKLHLYPYAVGNIDGNVELYQSDHPQSNSIREPKEHLAIFPKVVFDEMTTVKCIRLDTWYNERFKGRIIDFIWADVNGAEKDLIEGGMEALASTRYLYIEVAQKELYDGQQHYKFLDEVIPDFRTVCYYNWGGNFGNVLLKNKTL